MSERDDDQYLWTGSGPASQDVVELEKLFGGEKLTAPMRARPRRPLLLAIVVAALASAAAFATTHKLVPPDSWLGAVLPGVSADQLDDGSYQFELVDDHPPAGWQQAIEQRLREVGPSSVRFEGRRVFVDFTDGVPIGLAHEFAQRGELALKAVAEKSDVMQALYQRVTGGDPQAAELGVSAEIDQWDHDETGKRFTDYYLTAGSEQALRRYLASVAGDQRLRPADGFEIGVEGIEDGSAEPRFRTHYLASAVEVSNRDVVDAYVYWNDVTNRPEVLVEFSPEGGEHFAELTGRMVGRKLAILLDGRVTSAPVIQDRIAGGRISITMGGGTAEEVQREAQDLANTLRASQRPLPVALRLVSSRFGLDQLSREQIHGANGAVALLFGLLVFAAVWMVERRSRAIDPDVGPVRGRPRRRSLPWIRFAISAAGVTAAILAQRVPITGGVDWEQFGASWHISLFALGVMPALSAFLLVELAAIVVPRWRALQRGGPSARARLGSATAILTILLAVAQSWMIADFMLAMPPFAELSRAVLVLSFTAGAVVMTFLALVISRYGLGNGFAILLLTGLVAAVYRFASQYLQLRDIGDQPWGTTELYSVITAVIATALATAWILRHRVRGPSAASSLRLPTAGVVPIAVLPALLGLLALTWPEAAGRIGIWWQENVGRPGAGLLVELGFMVVVGAALSWLFSRPPRLGNATATDGAGARSHSFLIATALSIGYLVLLALIGRWVADELAYFGLTLVPVVFATAIAMDLVAEWRAFARRDDLVAVWPLHQVQRVDLVTGALTRNDIDVHVRGLYLRLLLHLFGPFVPVLLYVPAERAEEARAIIRAQLDAT